MNFAEALETQNEIITAQCKIIDSLFMRLCLLCAVDDIATWDELEDIMKVTELKYELSGHT